MTARRARGWRAGRPHRRLGAMLVVMTVGFSAVALRLVEVQALGGDRYAAFGESQRVRTVPLPGARGAILDRAGNDLALSIPRPTIWADPRLVEDPAATAAALAAILGVDRATLEDRLGGPGAFAYVARRVDEALAREVAELGLAGIGFLDEPKRLNPAGDLAISLLGQVGVDDEGLSGLELQFDELLAGEPGELVVERAPGGLTIPGGERQLRPATRGEDLVLTIDRSLQFEAERVLAEQVAAKGAKGGMAIISRPATGELLAIANVATDPDSGEVRPTRNNKAITTVFEPGSVNKVITLAGALEEGEVAPDTVLRVPDSIQVADHRFSDQRSRPPEDWSVRRILAESSNVGTIKIAQMLGRDRLDRYLREFGLGSRSGLGFPNEASGIMLAPEDWSGTSIGSIPIGQGIAVTALQMLSAFNVIANDGMRVPLRLVLETVDAAGARHPAPARPGRRVVSERTAAKMRDMLASAVSEGTGGRARVEGYTVAGKTGTARKPQPGGGYKDAAGNFRHVATFAGFAPAEAPELSIIVVVDEPTQAIFGGTVAAPVFADLAQYALRLLRVPPEPAPPGPAPYLSPARGPDPHQTASPAGAG